MEVTVYTKHRNFNLLTLPSFHKSVANRGALFAAVYTRHFPFTNTPFPFHILFTTARYSSVVSR